MACFDVPIDNRDLRVKELDLCRGPMGGELDGGMVVVEVSDTFFEVEFPVCPNHKHVVNVSPPSQCFFLDVEENSDNSAFMPCSTWMPPKETLRDC